LIIINVVNRHRDNAITTDIISQFGKFTGEANIYMVNGKNIKDKNSIYKQLVKTQTGKMKAEGDKITYSFPAHSYTTIRIPIEFN